LAQPAAHVFQEQDSSPPINEHKLLDLPLLFKLKPAGLRHIQQPASLLAPLHRHALTLKPQCSILRTKTLALAARAGVPLRDKLPGKAYRSCQKH
jgi:hypothetical protein